MYSASSDARYRANFALSRRLPNSGQARSEMSRRRYRRDRWRAGESSITSKCLSKIKSQSHGSLADCRWDRTQALRRWAAGSCRYRLLSEHAGASFPASISFLHPPVSSRTAGFPRSGWGQQLSPWNPPMMTSHVKRWPASFGYHQVCSKARRARLHRHAPACIDLDTPLSILPGHVSTLALPPAGREKNWSYWETQWRLLPMALLFFFLGALLTTIWHAISK
jgi:hypothetical protein